MRLFFYITIVFVDKPQVLHCEWKKISFYEIFLLTNRKRKILQALKALERKFFLNRRNLEVSGLVYKYFVIESQETDELKWLGFKFLRRLFTLCGTSRVWKKIFENVTSVKKNLKFVGLSVSTINTYYKSNERKNDRKRLRVVLNNANTIRE